VEIEDRKIDLGWSINRCLLLTNWRKQPVSKFNFILFNKNRKRMASNQHPFRTLHLLVTSLGFRASLNRYSRALWGFGGWIK
jgi:hypothetical protein